MDSPVGPLTLVGDGTALSGLYMDQQRYRPPQERFGEPDDTAFAQAREELRQYFAGRRQVFDVPLAYLGTPFQQAVWAALCAIPFGETTTYGGLAAELGRPTAARAVGHANGKNPISIIVPCHRLVGSTGALVDYGGGIERKQHLLEFERANAR